LSTGVFRKATRLLGVGSEPTPLVKPKPVMSHHAVTVVTGPKACAAARALAERRFLSREAPKLPLRSCDCASCECRYAHHEDRRRGPRRAREMGVALDGYDGQEKRTAPKRGRRKGDR
jgi:hypothetical protein